MIDWRNAGRRAAWGFGGAALVFAVGSLSFCLTLRSGHRAGVLELPDWTGRARDEAAAQARSLGLAFEVAEERHDAAMTAGHVLQQDPAPGTTVRPGRTVRVVVSLGGERLSVPGLKGQPTRQADLEIRRQGLESGWETRVHDPASMAGRVIDQWPPPGAMAAAGERVDRLVSDGARAPRWVMPDLAGRPLRAAQEWITLCGFRSGAVRRTAAAGSAPGTVVEQRPRAGWPIARGDAVELTVAD